ncbi:hypothetical protein OG206_23635 [Streptomyces sp. NBC_01341]|uniref:hypothetical protein n=1 Tax=Streptomyces sp. NBC_01341 TaxID=2903831 RepID=UPI002E101DC3|nr:hypothetical protein OG206_23635 [Streptomyces sp. NBC_01341]
MKLKTITRAAAVATGMTVAGLTLASSPASASAAADCGYACSVSKHVDTGVDSADYQAQVNNSTAGPGVTSWIWVWSNNSGAHADYYLNGDATMHKIYGPARSSASTTLSRDVTSFRVCGPNGFGGDACSAWAHPQY